MKTLGNRQFALILEQLLKEADSDKAIAAFAELVESRHASRRIDAICNEYAKIIEEKNTLQVTSAHTLSAEIKDQLIKVFGQNYAINEKIETDLLSGVVVQTDKQIFDTSAKSKLNRLKNSLLN